MGFVNNLFESALGVDLNGDGYIGGEGLISRLERATRFDLNGDNIIGRRPDVYYGYYGMPTYGIPYGFARYGGMYGYTRPYF